MTPAAIIFDLDGTLLDTSEDLADSANRALQRLGAPTHTVADYMTFIGAGAVELVRCALPEDRRDPTTIKRCLELFREEYGKAWNVKTHPYPGILDMLDGVVDRGIPMAVLSNKPEIFTVPAVKAYFDKYPFLRVAGAVDGVPRKPDPSVALDMAEGFGHPPNRCWFVGDSGIDMETGKRAGMRSIGVLWGFRKQAELLERGATTLVGHPRELVLLLDS
ncbi:MAG: hypothetical protein A2341_16655 [Deltaproteobacteria bacterium RIFOXYB12_FULL_58_9]|nr:MAG: hypothetical protein A2341_16655 [Deltaproteobacteria bacterium RIFOXYB12_FULL_58_9]